MELVIDDPDLLASIEQLSAATGQPYVKAVSAAVRGQLSQLAAAERLAPRGKSPEERLAILKRIASQFGASHELDSRTADEIIGYNEQGHFD